VKYHRPEKQFSLLHPSCSLEREKGTDTKMFAGYDRECFIFLLPEETGIEHCQSPHNRILLTVQYLFRGNRQAAKQRFAYPGFCC